jgi:ATP-dependent Lon protease
MPRDLPIFPLPLVLFPGAPQPLHIFEPRYRQMLTDCLAGDHRFGIAYVSAPAAPVIEAIPSPGDVGCVAVIQSAHQLPDGRADILTEGERRFHLLQWRPDDRLYRLARVEEFEDDPVAPGEADTVAADVRHGFLRLSEALGTLAGNDFEEPIELPDDPAALSFHVAAALELDASAKQALLAGRSTSARLRQLARLLGPLTAEAQQRAVVRERGRRNGRGGAHSHIDRTS